MRSHSSWDLKEDLGLGLLLEKNGFSKLMKYSIRKWFQVKFKFIDIQWFYSGLLKHVSSRVCEGPTKINVGLKHFLFSIFLSSLGEKLIKHLIYFLLWVNSDFIRNHFLTEKFHELSKGIFLKVDLFRATKISLKKNDPIMW